MIRLGLTGSIATGKSTALAAFAALGVPTFSADAAVHALYRGRAVPEVERLFPGVTRNGEIDRTALSAAVFAQPERLAALEAAVHPLVREELLAFLAAAEAKGAALAVVDIPLLFETGFDYGLDAVAVTTVGDAEQRRRALARPGMSGEKLDAMLARQMPQSENTKRADTVIDTSGTIAETEEQVRALVARLTTKSA